MASGKARNDEERDVRAEEPLRPAQVHDRSPSPSISRAPEPPTYSLYADEEAGRAPRSKLKPTGQSGPDWQDFGIEARRKKVQQQQRIDMSGFSDARIHDHFRTIKIRIFMGLGAMLLSIVIFLIVYFTALKPRSESNN